MRLNKRIFFGIFLIIGIILFSSLFLAYMTSNVQTFQFTQTNLSKAMCQAGQDFIIQITPFGCSPAVVRSDLLEENDVQVYCQLGATEINPLIDVETIDSISFSGTYPKEVSGIGFHPARAALGVEGNLNSPVLGNIGYVVINLRKQPNASAIPDYVSGNLTAKISYNVKNAFGIGKALFYLPEFPSDEKFETQKSQYSFWNGKGYLRADIIDIDSAQISVYTDAGKISTVSLKKGETSSDIYIPSFECQAGLKLRLDGVENSDTRAQLRINAEVVEAAKGEKFLDNKCQVRNLQSNGIVQRITLRCQEDTGISNFDLSISPKLILNINGEDKEFGLGEKLYEQGDKGIYLGYIGMGGTKTGDLFVYLVSMPQKKDKLSEEELSSVGSLAGDLTSAGQTSSKLIDKVEKGLEIFAGLSSSLGRAIANGETFYRINFGDTAEFFGKSVSITDFAGAQDKELSGDLKEQYDNAKKDYETIRESFSSEAYQETSTYGEEALYNEIMLAWDAEQKKSALSLCEEFTQSYPDSKKDMRICNDAKKLASQGTGEVYVTINKQVKKISFDEIFKPTFEEYGIRIMANTPQGTKYFDLRKEQAVSDTGLSVQFISAEETSAKVKISVTTSKGTKTEIVNLEKDVTNNFEEGYSFTLSRVNLKKVAKVSLIPNIDSTGTQTNFGFKIGIEKRAIDLPPEKIKEKITDLDASIGKWQNISNALGNVTQGLKKACIATGAGLVVKNFFLNAGPSGIARQQVMRGANGWFEKCEAISAQEHISVDKCLADNADKIDSDVEELSKIIDKQNSNIRELEKGVTTPGFLSEKVVDTDKFAEKYAPQVKNCLEKLSENSFQDPTGKEQSISKQEILTILSSNYNEGKYSIEQLRNIELFCMASQNSQLKEFSDVGLYSVLSDVKINSENYAEIITWASSLNNVPAGKFTFVEIGENAKKRAYEGLTLGQIGKTGLGGFSSDTPVALVPTSDGKKYIVVLDNQLGANLPIKDLGDNKRAIYDVDGTLVENPPKELLNLYFQRYDSSSYNNQYKNAELKYYETEPYKGLPAIVPFDLNKGWYAAIKQTLPTGSNIASYEASGRVSSFYLCNVGANGLEENIGGDDICEMINTGTGQPYDQFAGLSESEAKSIVDKAVQAIEQASRISETQRKGYVSILGQRIKVGEPAADIPDFQCQDFMSPKECLILFNLCDPVICPSSRCNLGGAYPVRDVVQSGVVGSVALCLPNAKEGIVVPVCLTGIKAGIDGFLSVKQSYRDCLQESLDTGKMVGICDEIYSIYMCDFFWKQALPFADLVVPKVVETLLGQNVRGGGEYLSVANAWDGANKAVNYFVNYYGTNSKKAFTARATEGIQNEVCKVYTSAVVPSGGDFLNTLTQPDSPSQFHGRFDEIPLTTATVPPTSHYKVFYHIFAGKDSGAYYQVYLRGVPGSSYYQDTGGNFMVASGYVAVGGYASETKDFTAVFGYKELCINVNGQEECGFKEVSTSFAANYIKDEYLASQATETDIKTESECISGSASAYSLLNPNAQSAAEEIVNPAIYNQGIIRVCATANPGQGTDAYVGTNESRWVDVGYCGNTKIRCWLDTKSVEDVIKTTTVEGEALQEVTTDYLEILKNEGNYLSEEQFSSAIEKINGKEPSEKIVLINDIINNVFWSGEKVQLLYLRGNSYAEIFRELWSKLPKPEAAPEIGEKPEEKPTNQEILSLGTVLPDEAVGTMDVIGLPDSQEKVILATKELAGESASRNIYDNCWDAAYQVYKNAKVGDSCVYSDADRKRYTIENERGSGKKTRITTQLYVNGRSFPDFTVYSNCYYGSSGSHTLNSKEKLDTIESGFLLSYAWRSNAGHNAIFIRWKDKEKRIAYLFDWNGYSQGSNNPVFRYYTEDLSDDKHPVYVYWQPVSKDESVINKLPIKEYPIKPEEETPTISESTATVREKIYAAARDIANNGASPNINDVAAMFVSRSLANAGVSGVQISGALPTSVDSLVSIIEKKTEFSEADVNNLKIGDIVLMGKGCQKNYSIGIVGVPKDSNNKIYIYTNLGSKVKIETIDFINAIDKGIYFYRAYRYTGDTKEIINARKKWTLSSAVIEVNERIGKYDANKIFVDQLVFDGILTEKDCGDVRGTNGFMNGLFNLQKDMNWLKKLLLAKCEQDESCKANI